MPIRIGPRSYIARSARGDAYISASRRSRFARDPVQLSRDASAASGERTRDPSPLITSPPERPGGKERERKHTAHTRTQVPRCPVESMARSRVLDTPSGKLSGSQERSCLGDDYFAFRGVPYAKPPVGPLRFRDPEPFEPWTGVRDATSHGPICTQFDGHAKVAKGSEDCLYLNVYTRNLDIGARAPVMVWIHGGCFQYGSGNDDEFGPDYLLQKDVVLVTMNYRLGIFGFLNLEDEAQTGNQGLKDQVMALEWVKSHIAHFGGSPENVTIFGGSAGAASVHSLCISPMAKGLFHRAICQSGCVLNPWAVKHEPKKTLYQFLELLGCKERDPKAILAYLRTADPYKLVEVQENFLTCQYWLEFSFPFAPGVDDKSDKPFMPVHPYVAAEEGVQVPLMLGHNSLEGIILLKILEGVDIKDMDGNFDKYVSTVVSNFLKRYNLTTRELLNLYLNNEELSELNLQKYLEYWSDVAFNEGIHRLVKIQFHNSAAPTYLYKLSHVKNVSLIRHIINTTIKGVSHGDELTYLFKSKVCDAIGLTQLQKGTGADKIMKQMVEMWTNFAKTGRPTPSTSDFVPVYWQPVASDVVLRYLNIDEDLHMEKMLNLEQRYSFKKNVHRMY